LGTQAAEQGRERVQVGVHREYNAITIFHIKMLKKKKKEEKNPKTRKEENLRTTVFMPLAIQVHFFFRRRNFEDSSFYATDGDPNGVIFCTSIISRN
jgi:hypothetical protein